MRVLVVLLDDFWVSQGPRTREGTVFFKLFDLSLNITHLILECCQLRIDYNYV